MSDPGPNYPAIIRRSADDVAEALTAAEQRGWAIMQSVGKETFDEMFRRINAQSETKNRLTQPRHNQSSETQDDSPHC